MLIIVCGLPGTGKTFVAKAISEKLDAALLRTDVIRKDVAGKPAHSKEERDSIYKIMFLMAEKRLKIGANCVLDATFNKKDLRAQIREIAQKNNTGFVIVECVCSENIVKERMDARTGDESDADFNVYLEEKRSFEPIEGDHIIVDTAKDINENMEMILKEFRKNED